MFNLIKNEIYKTFKTKKLYVFMAIIFFYNFLPSLEKVMGTIDESNIIINGQNVAFYMLNYMISTILPVFMVVAMSDMITAEYVNGTLQLPLLHPVSRTKLLASKAAALFIPLIFLMIFSLITSYALGTLIFGWGDQFIYQQENQSIAEGTVYSTLEGILVTLSSYLLSIFPLITFGMLIMFIALNFNSAGVTVGVSIGLIIFMSIVGEVATQIRPFLIIHGFSLFKILFVSKNISEFIMVGMINALYGLGFYLSSIYVFRKKDLTY